MADAPVRGTKRDTSANTLLNSLDSVVEAKIHDTINTAELVTINLAEGQDSDSNGGRARCTPLVAQVDGFNNAIATTPIPNLPFYRPQAGKAAILMRPQPGDTALAIYCKRDSSGVDVGTRKSVRPGSFRAFDQADGCLLNGFLGQAPEIWLLLDPESGDIELSTKAAKIDITCRESGDILISTAAGKFTISATDNSDIDAPRVTFSGDVVIKGGLTVEGTAQGANGGPATFSNGIINEAGGIQNTGGISNTGGNIVTNNITVETHEHSDVAPGGSNSGSPVVGT